MSKKKAYVIGANVSTSLSPVIFEHWFKKYDVDAEYGFIEIKEENFDKEIKPILKEDGLVGLNITMPFKEKITPYLTSVESAQHTRNTSTKDKIILQGFGRDTDVRQHHIEELNKIIKLPVNCISINGDEIIGKNTDCYGFENACYSRIDREDFKLSRRRLAIVLGYGGVAKAIIYSLVYMGCDYVMVFNRTFDKIKNLKHTFKGNDHFSSSCYLEPHKIEELPKKIKGNELIVNTTPVNILNNSIKWNTAPNCVGLDVVYKPREGTGFLNHFEPSNRIEGIQMLVYQAAPCFKLWFGVEPEIDEQLFDVLYKKMDENK